MSKMQQWCRYRAVSCSPWEIEKDLSPSRDSNESRITFKINFVLEGSLFLLMVFENPGKDVRSVGFSLLRFSLHS